VLDFKVEGRRFVVRAWAADEDFVQVSTGVAVAGDESGPRELDTRRNVSLDFGTRLVRPWYGTLAAICSPCPYARSPRRCG
jgi:hypothetical protein